MAEVMAITSLVAGAVSAAGTIAAGSAKQSSANFTATQEDMAAQESRAASQRSAQDKDRQTALTLSKLQAGAAASGGGASDPGILTLAGHIAGRGEYESLMDMYTGENKARGLEDEATGQRTTGAALADASDLSAAGTLIGSAGSAYRTYKGVPDRIAYG
jgi:hypothetical protein